MTVLGRSVFWSRDGTSLWGRVFLVGLRVSGTALTACRHVTTAATALSSGAKIFPLALQMLALPFSCNSLDIASGATHHDG